MTMTKENCGCWIDLKKGIIIPVCDIHYKRQLAFAKGEGPALKPVEICGTPTLKEIMKL